jgi:rhamnulose-1-phosphate aldolase
MKDLLYSPMVAQLTEIVTEMYAHGWDERNGGNVSVLLDEAEVAGYIDPDAVLRKQRLSFRAPELAGRYVLVTGTGKYFRHVKADPARNIGLVRVGAAGDDAELLWGLTDGGGVTSEFPAHMMSHVARLRMDPRHRVVMHCHPVNLLAMTYVHPLEERAFTRTLWRMCTECMMVFPDGVGVLPWMLCGTDAIGAATAEKMALSRLVVWAQHGIYGAGRDLDETFGLIETAEKAAEVYLKIAPLPRLNTITDEQLRQIARRFGVQPREGYLD